MFINCYSIDIKYEKGYTMLRKIERFVTGTSSSQDRNCADDGEEDAWSVWGRVANDWETTYRRKTAFVKVTIR